MNEKEAKQHRVNTRNIAALVSTMEQHSKVLKAQNEMIQIQAKSLQTMQNQIDQMHISMSNATAAMGNGPTG